MMCTCIPCDCHIFSNLGAEVLNMSKCITMIWNECKHHVMWHFHIMFILFPYYVHIIFPWRLTILSHFSRLWKFEDLALWEGLATYKYTSVCTGAVAGRGQPPHGSSSSSSSSSSSTWLLTLVALKYSWVLAGVDHPSAMHTRVDLLAKVRYFQELHNKAGLEKRSSAKHHVFFWILNCVLLAF